MGFYNISLCKSGAVYGSHDTRAARFTRYWSAYSIDFHFLQHFKMWNEIALPISNRFYLNSGSALILKKGWPGLIMIRQFVYIVNLMMIIPAILIMWWLPLILPCHTLIYPYSRRLWQRMGIYLYCIVLRAFAFGHHSIIIVIIINFWPFCTAGTPIYGVSRPNSLFAPILLKQCRQSER